MCVRLFDVYLDNIDTLFSNWVAIFQVLLRGGSTYRDMLKGEEARREDLDIDIEVKFNKICNVPFAAGVTWPQFS